VAAEEIAGIGTLHVGSRVDDYVPGGLGWRVAQVQCRLDVGIALPVRHDGVQSERDASAGLTCSQVDVRDVGRVRLQTLDLQLDARRPRLRDEGDGAVR